jgi:hypothetical protein
VPDDDYVSAFGCRLRKDALGTADRATS